MSKHDEPFLPEQVDEQIDALTGSVAPSTPHARLISHLHETLREDTEIVAQVRARLTEYLAAHHPNEARAENPPPTVYPHQRKRSHAMEIRPTEPTGRPAEPMYPERIGYPEGGRRRERPPSEGRRFEWMRENLHVRLLAALAAVLIIAAMIGGGTFVLRNRPLGKQNTPTQPEPPTSGLYVTTTTEVARVDLQSGQILWQTQASMSAQPVVLGNVVVVSSTPDPAQQLKQNIPFIEGLDANNGKVLWHVSNQASYLQGANGMVYASGCAGMAAVPACAIQAISANTGTLYWSYPTPEGTAWIAPVQNGTLYGATLTHFFALDTDTGKVLWQKTVPTVPAVNPAQIIAAPVISNGTLYLTACDNSPDSTTQNCSLTAFNSRNGTEQWGVLFPRNEATEPAVVGNNIYIGTTNGRIIDLDVNNNIRGVWSNVLYSSAKGLLVANGIIYAEMQTKQPNGPWRLLALNATSLKSLWSLTVSTIYSSGQGWQTLEATSTQFYMVNGLHTINILNPTSGTLVRTYTLTDPSPIVEFEVI